ncbi:MAG: NAD(P)-dependent oxidoreductase [Bacteriovoracaceae bacterium]|nr:NAD(P)-dependent oxidoreductase [Bacteriovoracaceae bacterium]
MVYFDTIIKERAPVFITGGSGFLGSAICRQLTGEKILHTIYDRAVPQFRSQYATYIKGDIRDLNSLASSLKHHRTIIHLAAEWNDVGVANQEYRTTNIDGTRNIVLSAESNNVSYILFASSSSVYGFKYNNSNPCSESDAAEKPETLYGQTKVAGEEVLQNWVNKSIDRSLKIIRPSVIYGPYNRGNVYNLIKQINTNYFIFPAKYDVVKSIAYVENVASFLIYFLKNKTSDIIYNYCDNPSLTTLELVNKIYSLLNKKGKLITVNPKLLLLVSSLLDYFPSGVRNKYGSMKVKKILLPTYLSNELALKSGYHQSISIEVGLQKTVEWILQSKKGIL